MHGTMNDALMVFKKLSGYLKVWDLVMNPYEQYACDVATSEKQLTML